MINPTLTLFDFEENIGFDEQTPINSKLDGNFFRSARYCYAKRRDKYLRETKQFNPYLVEEDEKLAVKFKHIFEEDDFEIIYYKNKEQFQTNRKASLIKRYFRSFTKNLKTAYRKKRYIKYAKYHTIECYEKIHLWSNIKYRFIGLYSYISENKVHCKTPKA